MISAAYSFFVKILRSNLCVDVVLVPLLNLAPLVDAGGQPGRTGCSTSLGTQVEGLGYDASLGEVCYLAFVRLLQPALHYSGLLKLRNRAAVCGLTEGTGRTGLVRAPSWQGQLLDEVSGGD